MVYREACDKREAAARVAVAHPEQLARDPWAAHLRECPECRETSLGMAQSLAVFRRMETERQDGRGEIGPSWERVAAALQGEPRYRVFLRRYRMPVAAAAVGGLLLFSGAGAWYAEIGGGQENMPARIVRLQPEQRQRMQQVVQQSLAGPYGGAPAIAQSRPVPRLTPVEPIATEELAVEPNGLYASGERTLPGESVFHQNHPFLEGRDMATADEDRPRSNPPLYPVISGSAGMSPVSFPVFHPDLR
jgi:hypothetical protein